MENRIPLPTDNVFKFYALFGLLLLLFGFSSVIYLTKSTNDFMATAYVDLAALKAKADSSAADKARIQIIERQAEVIRADKKFFEWGAALVTSIGLLGMVIGFGEWHFTYQRRLDENARLQAEKLRWEIKALKRRSRKRQ